MTEKEREELIGKMTDAMFATDEDGTLRVDVMARAALAVAEPVIREQCAKIADKTPYAFNVAKDMNTIAAAIREMSDE